LCPLTIFAALILFLPDSRRELCVAAAAGFLIRIVYCCATGLEFVSGHPRRTAEDEPGS
jgi:hypothetical protein